MKVVKVLNGQAVCPSCGQKIEVMPRLQQLNIHLPRVHQFALGLKKSSNLLKRAIESLVRQLKVKKSTKQLGRDSSAVKKNSLGEHRAKAIGAMNMPLPAKIPGEMTIWVQKADKDQCAHILVDEPRVIGESIKKGAVKPP